MSGGSETAPFRILGGALSGARRDFGLALLWQASTAIVMLPAAAAGGGIEIDTESLLPALLLTLGSGRFVVADALPPTGLLLAAAAALAISIPFSAAVTFRALGGDRRSTLPGSAAAAAWRHSAGFSVLLAGALLADLALGGATLLAVPRLAAILPPDADSRLLMAAGAAILLPLVLLVFAIHRVAAHARAALVRKPEGTLVGALRSGAATFAAAPFRALVLPAALVVPIVAATFATRLILDDRSLPWLAVLVGGQAVLLLRQVQKCAVIRAEALLHQGLVQDAPAVARAHMTTFAESELVLSKAEPVPTLRSDPADDRVHGSFAEPEAIAVEPPIGLAAVAPDAPPVRSIAASGEPLPDRRTEDGPGDLPESAAAPSPHVEGRIDEDGPSDTDDGNAGIVDPPAEIGLEPGSVPEPAELPVAARSEDAPGPPPPAEIPPPPTPTPPVAEPVVTLREVLDEPSAPDAAVSWPATIQGIELENALAEAIEAEELRDWKPPLGDLPTERVVLRPVLDEPVEAEPEERPNRFFPFRFFRRAERPRPAPKRLPPGRSVTRDPSPPVTAWRPLLDPGPPEPAAVAAAEPPDRVGRDS